MATLFAGAPRHGITPPFPTERNRNEFKKGRSMRWRWMLLAGVVFIPSMTLAQNTPQVTAVDPASGKVNDPVTVSGSDMGKASVSAVYLSDDKNDFKATILDQSNDKITLKVPQ